MSRGWWNCLWIVVVCWSLACSNSSEPSKTADNENATNSGGTSGGAKLLPPDPDESSGIARVSDSSPFTQGSGKEDSNPFRNAPAAEKSPAEKGAARTSLGGRWILVLTRPSREGGFIDFHTGIVEIANGEKSGDGLQATWLAQTGVLQPAQLEQFEI